MSLTYESRDRMINEIADFEIEINGMDVFREILIDGCTGHSERSDEDLIDMYEQLDSCDQGLIDECRAQLVIEEVLT